MPVGKSDMFTFNKSVRYAFICQCSKTEADDIKNDDLGQVI